ncbi:substrate-binding domain-containing protein [Treponema sp.]|uniref:substrate-binding domain-containing protein n=1 Tax=Treponema sp. TaxID=166 RepID=UPI0025E2939F|nr:substrate-binding domain-containing protein [Treponema sp.]MCR5218663.1 substrate-binding domain-containing protein [Treponema sp.]
MSCAKQQKVSSEKKHSEASQDRITIGVSIDTLAIERWQRDIDIFINKVREMRGQVIVQNAGNSIEEQNRQLMYLLDKGVDAIVVLPKDANSITESVQKIKAKGIPVISYDRLTLNADIDLYLTIDSEKVGEYMASEMLRRTTGRNWYCILGPKEDYNMTLIQEGLDRILRTTSAHISHTFYTEGWNYDLSYQEIVRILKEGTIPDAIICGNDAVAASVIQALSRYYPEMHIPICGQDADIAACQYIVQGKQDFTIYKPIIRLAEYAAECAVHLARGEEIETENLKVRPINNGYANINTVWLEPTYVDKYNIDKLIIESGFHSAASVYGDNSSEQN